MSNMFENKKILVLGMARSGYEVSKLLSKYNNDILVTDQKDQDKKHLKELKKLGVKFKKMEDPMDLIDESYDYVIKNPGIRYDHPLIIKAITLGIKILNEVEVAYHLLPKDTYIIGITGANGKTTTTTLIYDIIKSSKKRVHLAGNIGYPLSSIVNKVKSNDIIVIEISAQQLHDMYDFTTDVSILTNLIPVHIDFFGDYENYINHKLKIFQNHTKKNIAIINKNNEDSYNNTEDIKSNKLYFSCSEKTDSYIKDDSIYYKNKKIIDICDLKVKGNHNYENIMCAILACKQVGISDDVINKTLKKFKGVEHRNEFVRTLKGRNFYNDSKATNVKSTEIALKSFNNPVILLLGGLDRSHSFEELRDNLGNVKNIVCFGQTKDRIELFSKSCNIPCKKCETLKEAVKYAYSVSDKGDTILLSPACASWDQFKDFEARGLEFKKVVKRLR